LVASRHQPNSEAGVINSSHLRPALSRSSSVGLRCSFPRQLSLPFYSCRDCCTDVPEHTNCATEYLGSKYGSTGTVPTCIARHSAWTGTGSSLHPLIRQHVCGTQQWQRVNSATWSHRRHYERSI